MNILVLCQPGTISRQVMLDLARGVERAGHRCFYWELEPMWAVYQRDAQAKPRALSDFSALAASFIRANGIDASIGMWANGLFAFMHGAHPGPPPRPAPFFEVVRCPHLLMWLDAPHWAHEGGAVALSRSPILQSPYLTHVINNPHTAREMTEVLGYRRVVPRAYGVCESTFRPHPGERREFDIVFASGPGDPAPTPEALQELDAAEPDMLRVRASAARLAAPALNDLAAGAGDGMRELFAGLIEAQLRDRHEPMLDRLRRLAASGHADAAARLMADPKLFVAATMQTRTVERFERAFTLAYLARRFRVGLMGGGDYSAWRAPVTPLGSVPHDQQSRMYSRAAVGLNVMRWQDDHGLNLKSFEITASGAACLVSRRGGLSDLFDESREVAAFDSPGHAALLLRDLLESPQRLAVIAAAGYERTQRDHTWSRWASDLIPRLAVP